MNKFILFAALIVLLLAVYSVDAKRGRSRSRGGSWRKPSVSRSRSGRPGLPKPKVIPRKPFKKPSKLPDNAESYSWGVNITVNSVSANVQQKAIAIMEMGSVRLYAKASKEVNTSASMVFMNVSTGVMALKDDMRGPCFMTTTSLNNETVQADLNRWNGSDIQMSNSVRMNGTGARMSDNESRDLKKANPGLRKFCSKSPMIRVEVISGYVTLSDDEKLRQLLGYDTMVSMVVKAKKPKGKKKGGKGGKKGKGGWKGKGRKRNQRRRG